MPHINVGVKLVNQALTDVSRRSPAEERALYNLSQGGFPLRGQPNTQIDGESVTGAQDAGRIQTTADPLSNLGVGGTIVTLLVSSFFAARIVCNLTVLLLYGRHAFFDGGLRVEDWKHSILSNGVRLPWYGTLMIGPTILPICAAAVFGAEFVAKHLRSHLAQRSLWAVTTARLLGGTALVALSIWFYSPPNAFPPVHPIPLSALVGGVVLVWRALVTFFRRPYSS